MGGGGERVDKGLRRRKREEQIGGGGENEDEGPGWLWGVSDSRGGAVAGQ